MDGVFNYNATTDNYRAYLEWMQQLWEAEVIDPEIFSQAPDQLVAKGQNNQVGLFQTYFSYFVTGQTEAEALNNPMF